MMLLVFDLDGTLVDSRRDLADAANALIAERGGAPLPVEAITRMVGEGAALLVRRALAAAGCDPSEAHALPRFLELYDQRLLAHTRPYDGIPDAVRALASEHDLAVLTNKPIRPSREILRGLGLFEYLREIVGGDGPYARKPDPAGLVGIMRELGHDPDGTVMVGDSRIDVATARAAHTKLCVARYGFGFREDEIEFQAGDLAVDTPSDLTRVLRSPNLRSPNLTISRSPNP
jgi:phosphoglycolate phosphatase